MKEFDLNIGKILEDWEIYHAIREIIANALDEQLLTNTAKIDIVKTGNVWCIRDFGRGLNYHHLTQNENPEKTDNDKVIGRFGVGLKDALATLFRHNIGVEIQSKFGVITLKESTKNTFDDIVTLHAQIAPPVDSQMLGTAFYIYDCPDYEIDKAKRMFLRFSDEKIIETTSYGQVIAKTSDTANIYINGVKVAEEPNFAFSYNITALSKQIKKALNRERTNVGRTAYADRIKSILLEATNKDVVRTLSDNLESMSDGGQCDEIKWVDVAAHVVKELNDSEETVFVTPDELANSSGSTSEILQNSGKRIVFVPESVKKKAEQESDGEISTIKTVVQDYNESFSYSFIDVESLTEIEKKNWGKIPTLLEKLGLSSWFKKCFISEKLKEDADNTVGVWDRELQKIIILRTQLKNETDLFGTVLHEIIHARTGAGDVSRYFECELTEMIGKISSLYMGELCNPTSRTDRGTADSVDDELFDDDDLFLDEEDLFDDVDEESYIQISFDELNANPQKYIGKQVELIEKVSLGTANQVRRKSFYCYKIVGDHNYDIDAHTSIELFYSKLSDVKKIVMLNPDFDAVSVKGKIVKYTDSDNVYIDAIEIIGLEAALSEIEEPDSEYSSFAELRQIVAFPKEYENRPYDIYEPMCLLENDPQNKTMLLCESTGEGKDDYNKNVSIKVSYLTCSNAEELLSITAAKQKVKVFGYVGYDTKETTAYMVGRTVAILRSFDEKPYGNISYCKEHCEFYEKCLARKESCVKKIYEETLFTLTPREEKTIRLSFGIECPTENSLENIMNETAAISVERVEQIRAKALRKLRHPRRARPLRTSDIGLILFSQKETGYSKLWRAIFGESRPQHEMYQEFAVAKVEEDLKEAAERQEEKEKEEWREEKAKRQSQITAQTTISDCCFGDKYDGGILESELTIEELRRMSGRAVFESCDYNKKIFEEIISVLHSHHMCLADYPPVCNMQSYCEQIYNDYTKEIRKESLSKTIEELDFSVRTYNCLKRAGLDTLAALTQCTEEDIIKVRNMGKKSFEEIVDKLSSLGLCLLGSENVLRECSGESIKDKVLQLTIEELDFSVRTFSCLKRAGIDTVKDLTERTYDQMLKVRNLGKKSLEEVVQKLYSLGVSLKPTPQKGYKSFRDVYHKICVVRDNGYCLDTFKTMQQTSNKKILPDDIQANSALVYGYIDKMCGFSYRVLGLTNCEDAGYTLEWSADEVGLTVRGDCFKVFDFFPAESTVLEQKYEKEIEIINTGYSNENDELLRSLTFLDKFRHYDCPDDILAILLSESNDLKPEKIWVRPTEYAGEKQGKQYFVAKLLNDPFSDFGVHNGDDVVLVIGKQNDEDVAICFSSKGKGYII